MFILEVAVDVIPMLIGGNKYVANCGAADNRKRVEDFKVEGSNMRDLLITLVNKMDDLEILKDAEVKIVGEFNADDLSPDDNEAWATPLNEIREHDSGLNRFLRKLNV